MDPHAGLGGGAAPQGEPSPEPSPPKDPVPTRLELTLVDRTGMVEASPRHGEGPAAKESDHVLADAEVELRSFDPEAVEEVSRGRSDAAGRIVLDLGMRVPGSPFRLRATRSDGRVYIAKQQELITGGGPIHLYRLTTDHSAIEQAVLRIVTLAPGGDPGAERQRVQVRQIIRYSNRGFEAFDGPPRAEGIGCVFPVPEGAQVLDVRLGEDSLLDVEPRAIEHWGYGVPVPQPIFPPESWLLMGVYQLEVEKGEIFDLGLEAAVHTRGIQLSLETNVISYDERAARDAGETPLVSQGAQEMRDVGKNMTVYTSGAIPAHGKITLPARLGPPRGPGFFSAKTLMALLIVACFAVPILAGIAIAKRRAEVRDPAALGSRLRALHRSGELSDADLARELARIGAAEPPGVGARGAESQSAAATRGIAAATDDPKTLARLEEIAARRDATPEGVAADLRDLARILRDQLRERTR